MFKEEKNKRGRLVLNPPEKDATFTELSFCLQDVSSSHVVCLWSSRAR